MNEHKQKQQERGSIMLEVVAVLALMGVMGAMLFRQIYQRNQELHNIQMASEIRTVKEAFSAYIQANRSSVLATCNDPGHDDVAECDFDDYDGVADYLPDGWFTGDELIGAYTLTIWNYELNDGKRIIYGIIVPTTSTLPTTGWNFRRAARVALLIGADGGAYDAEITSGSVAGALGSWTIETRNLGRLGIDASIPTYVATTGIDLFTPEYEMPEGDMKLPEKWSLALKGLHAYNHFSVGNKGTGDCYGIQHDHYSANTSGDNIEGTVENDSVPGSLSDACKPLFWVGSKTGGALGDPPNNGNVYVATDLNIGSINGTEHDEALKLTAEGVIKQKNGLTIDKDGRIIAGETLNKNIGDLKEGEHFLLDPGHTSTMMDIRLASRGGVRLSDILPNYILKEQFEGYCTVETDLTKNHSVMVGCSSPGGSVCPAASRSEHVSWCDLVVHNVTPTTSEFNFPTCPKDYKVAIVVIPSTFGGEGGHKVTKNTHTHAVSGSTTTDATIGAETNTGFVSDIKRCKFFATVVTKNDLTVSGKSLDHSNRIDVDVDSTTENNKFYVPIGYRKNSSHYNSSDGPTILDICDIGEHETLHAVVQTYCVWTPSLYDCKDGDDCETKKQQCAAAGYVFDTSSNKCTSGHGVEARLGDRTTGSELSKGRCIASGFKWEPNRCTFIYMTPAEINDMDPNNAGDILWNELNISDLTPLKASACKAAGHTWNEATSTCSN